MINKHKSRILTRPPKRKSGRYSYLKIWLVILLGIFLWITVDRYIDLWNYPYYPSDSADVIITLISSSFAVITFLVCVSMLLAHNTQEIKKKYRYRSTQLKIYLTLIYVFVPIISLAAGFFAKGLISMMMVGILSAFTSLIGTPQFLPVEIRTNIFLNSDYQKSITISQGKTSYSIIDPAPYKIATILNIKGHSYPISNHCYTGKSKPQLISHQYDLKMKVSFLGFKCLDQCHLNQRFQNQAGETIAINQLLECRELYRRVYNETDN